MLEWIDGRRRLKRRAGAALAAGGAGLLFAVVYTLLYLQTQPPRPFLSEVLAFGLVFPITGAVLIYRHPGNVVGWLMVGLGLCAGLPDLLNLYATAAARQPAGRLPLGEVAVWTGTWIWTFSRPAIIGLILVFPNGRLLSPRWKALIWLALATTLPLTLLIMINLWPLRGSGLLAAGDDISRLGPVGVQMMRVLGFWEVVDWVEVLAAVYAFGARFAQARGIERAQMKWILSAVALVPVGMLLGMVSNNIPDPLLKQVYPAVNLLVILAFPAALVIAMTRYHLYEIDVIIHRTVIYTLLTLILGAVYLVSVLVMQALWVNLIRGQSSLVIVISTLLIAALFRPLYARIQSVIDRRFYRRHYNAELTLEKFSAHLRSGSDPDEFDRRIINVVNETLQPTSVDLWIIKQK